jgi:hypothetical protein
MHICLCAFPFKSLCSTAVDLALPECDLCSASVGLVALSFFWADIPGSSPSCVSPPLLCTLVFLIAMPLHAKGSDAPFEVERRLCVKGGRLKGWMTLPVIEVDGRECVMVSARSSFLTNMAFGNTAEHRHELTKLCAEVRDLLLRAEGLTETASAQTEQSVGKSTLNLDADDDAAPAVRPSPSKKQKRGGAASWHEIQLRGVPVLCRIRCGQQILLQGPVEAVTSLVEALGRPSSREATDKPHKKADLQPITNNADNGRIKWRWSSSHRLGGWVVQYKVEENGPTCTKHSGLDVPKLNFLGEEMGHASYMEVRSQVLQKARAEWNALDQTSAVRYCLG